MALAEGLAVGSDKIALFQFHPVKKLFSQKF
jgi:hypothetical protein